ncbi:hypothetical protein DRN38_04855 [Thermococci archaeon]|nr:MAG: hypothetical protein DRN51_01610 [Thermococci archaeon]RLF79930.1 MAG: hypothetical protein DRN38_04855 [Thermococci archaeon]RLF83530.1 MAG: hypothetical protein DRN48_07720 [Thermococci archaeon]
MEKLKAYLEEVHRKASYAEELYGIKIRYVPIIVEEKTVVLDRENKKIKRLEEKIIENIENGTVELYLTITFGEDIGLR